MGLSASPMLPGLVVKNFDSNGAHLLHKPDECGVGRFLARELWFPRTTWGARRPAHIRETGRFSAKWMKTTYRQGSFLQRPLKRDNEAVIMKRILKDECRVQRCLRPLYLDDYEELAELLCKGRFRLKVTADDFELDNPEEVDKLNQSFVKELRLRTAQEEDGLYHSRFEELSVRILR